MKKTCFSLPKCIADRRLSYE